MILKRRFPLQLFVQKIEAIKAEQGQFEKPQLRKVAKPEEKPKEEEKKDEKPKKKVVKKKADKDYELPEIPDYERPALEKYEKSEFTPSERDAKQKEISEPAKPQQGVKSEPAPEDKLKNGMPKKEKETPEAPEARKLQMGKGKVPDNKEEAENVKLKPTPQKQVLFFGPLVTFKLKIYKKKLLKNTSHQKTPLNRKNLFVSLYPSTVEILNEFF